LRIFDHLKTWATATDVARRLEIHAGKTALFLDSLTACGYVRKFCGRFRNSQMANQYLFSGSGQYQGRVFKAMSHMRLQGLDRLADLLRGDDPESFRLQDESVWSRAAEHLLDFQKSISPFIIDRLHALKDMSDRNSLLDLGGGPGYVGFAVLKEFPHMKGTLFDLPQVAEKARANAAAMNLLPRVRIIGGDYNKDGLGRGYDLVIAGRCLYYGDRLDCLMKRIAESMNKGGILFCMHEGLFNERTAPGDVVISRIGVALRGADVSFERGEMENAMAHAGLEILSIHNSDDPGGNTDLIVGRRP
jgi:SAM-dependent methyltransferase